MGTSLPSSLISAELKSLEVTVIPMETSKTPYRLHLNVRGNTLTFILPEHETSLKNVFSDDNPDKYWVDIFREHSPQQPPGYRYAPTRLTHPACTARTSPVEANSRIFASRF